MINNKLKVDLKKGDISNPTLKVDGRENFLSIKIFTF
jgi:hypothetical protein